MYRVPLYKYDIHNLSRSLTAFPHECVWKTDRWREEQILPQSLLLKDQSLSKFCWAGHQTSDTRTLPKQKPVITPLLLGSKSLPKFSNEVENAFLKSAYNHTPPLATCIQNTFNPFPNKPWFLRVCSKSLLKTLWEKEKLLVTSNFSFSHNVFYPLRELSVISSNLKLSSANSFNLEESKMLSFGKGLNTCNTILIEIFFRRAKIWLFWGQLS